MVSHLGMSGKYTLVAGNEMDAKTGSNPMISEDELENKHDHVVFHSTIPTVSIQIIDSDLYSQLIKRRLMRINSSQKSDLNHCEWMASGRKSVGCEAICKENSE